MIMTYFDFHRFQYEFNKKRKSNPVEYSYNNLKRLFGCSRGTIGLLSNKKGGHRMSVDIVLRICEWMERDINEFKIER